MYNWRLSQQCLTKMYTSRLTWKLLFQRMYEIFCALEVHPSGSNIYKQNGLNFQRSSSFTSFLFYLCVISVCIQHDAFSSLSYANKQKATNDVCNDHPIRAGLLWDMRLTTRRSFMCLHEPRFQGEAEEREPRNNLFNNLIIFLHVWTFCSLFFEVICCKFVKNTPQHRNVNCLRVFLTVPKSRSLKPWES